MLVEQARVDRRRLLAGARVDLGAHAVEDLVDLERAEAVGPLNSRCSRKCEMPASVGVLVARAGPDPEPERDRAHGGHCLGDDPDARVELGQLVLVLAPELLRAVAAESRSPRSAVAAGAASRRPPRRRRRARRVRRGRHGHRRRGHRGPPPPPPPPPVPTVASSSADLPAIVGVVGQAQADAAALAVDLDHADLDLVAAVEDVLDRVDALAGRDVGDVQQAVGALGQLDEGAERGRLDDLARERVADLDLLGHRADALGQRRRPARRWPSRRSTWPSSLTSIWASNSSYRPRMVSPPLPMTRPILSGRSGP